MFENFTFDYLIERMIKRIQYIDNTIDTSEGSLIYTAVASSAWELAENYIAMDTVLEMAFADTAPREELVLRAKEYGMEPKKATQAILRGVFNIDIPLGTRFSAGDLYYITTEKMDAGTYKMLCETPGTRGNSKLGALTSTVFMEGLENANLTELLVSGEDEEDTEDFRNRYFSLVRTPTTSGNANHYRQWALEVNGVGDAKVFPLWDGPGTIKVVIVDNDKQPVSISLLESTLEHIEKLRPIGAEVSVVSGTAKQINVTAKINLSAGYSLPDIIANFTTAVTEYFKSIAFGINYVSIAKIGTILLSAEGVIDYSNLQLDSTTSNIALTEEEIPILGTVNLEV